MEKPGQSDSMLVRSQNLDQLLLLAGEVIIASSNLGLAYRNLQSLFDRHAPVNRENLEAVKDLATATADISSNLHHLVQAIRTVELKDMSFRLKRLVRDVARKTGKRIRFDVSGEETVVDKSIVDRLFDPIAHQLRNAIDHGIEDAAARVRAGKQEEGVIRLQMANTERDTLIEISDDGAGVNLEALHAKAIQRGLVSETDPFTEKEALEVMCQPGVSTAENITQFSGRGVGMDVVRSQLAELGGSLLFETRRGHGSTFTFKVPLVSAVNITDALVVEAAGTLYAFPITAVVTTMAVPAQEIKTSLQRGAMVRYLDHLVPLHDMHELLTGQRAPARDGMAAILIIEYKEDRVALAINEFLAPQKLVIIPIGETLPIPELAGATILGGRKLGFIMDVPALVSRAMGRAGSRDMRSMVKAAAARSAGPAATAAAPTTGEPARAAPPAAALPTDERAETPATAADKSENRDFLMEIERLVPTLNEALFALESDPGNAEHINSAFRLFHTIKGNFVMIGLAQGGTTVHSVESVLDWARSGQLAVSAEVMDLLMDGVSFIEEAVRRSIAGEWTDQVSQDLLDRSARFLPQKVDTRMEVADAATAEVTLCPESAYRAILHRKRHTPFYQCYLEFDAGRQPPGLVACLIYRRFCDLGDVLGAVPTLDDLEMGMAEGKFKLLFASPMAPVRIESILNGLLRPHYGVSTIKLTRFD